MSNQSLPSTGFDIDVVGFRILSPPFKGWDTAVQNPDTDFDSVWEGFAGSKTEKKTANILQQLNDIQD